MCGFVGFLAQRPISGALDGAGLLHRMSAQLIHRGPDGEGVRVYNREGLGLAHRRLSIVDLSAAGAQPMLSASQRYTLVFNGEIYNHLALRTALNALSGGPRHFRGTSDTETLLACVEEWGLETALNKALGMFSLALWDQQKRTLALARDRFGEKPLYYAFTKYEHEQVLLFGSDLAAFKPFPEWSPRVSRSSVAEYLNYGYVGGRASIYEHCYKVLPGEVVIASAGSVALARKKWWDTAEAIKNRVELRTQRPKEITEDFLASLLEEVVADHMLADVPLGAFLSGGVDSTLLVAIMQRISSRPIKTFTIGFTETDYDEAPVARAVATHLGTDHTERYLGPKDLLDAVPQISLLFTEPFADSSQIPTYLVSKLARETVTVAVSGDGGDEMFGGYNRYRFAAKYGSTIFSIPRRIRGMVAAALRRLPKSALITAGGGLGLATMEDKYSKILEALTAADTRELYGKLTQKWPNSVLAVADLETPEDQQQAIVLKESFLDPVEEMMLNDLVGYLPDDVLVKVDRASMGVSLETRAPFLDQRVFDIAFRLEASDKLRNGVTKSVLRKLLNRYLPAELVSGPKRGFAVPIGQWLRGPLRPWAEELLSEHRLRNDGIFNASVIRKKWSEHISGKLSWQEQIWSVLMFQQWLSAAEVHGTEKTD